MNTFFKSGLVLLMCTAVSVSVGAKPAGKSNGKTSVKENDFVVDPPADDYAYMTSEQYAALKKEVNEKKEPRTPSAKPDFVDSNIKFSPQYLNLQAKLIGGPLYDENGQKTDRVEAGADSAEKLAELIQAADDDAKYAKLPNDAKFIAAALATMKPYQGLAFRARPLFDKNNFVHAIMISGLRAAATGINVFLPTPQWKSGFQYFVEPLPVKYTRLPEALAKTPPKNQSERKTTYIENETNFFMYINFEILPSMHKYASRLNQLVQESAKPGFKPIYFDNKLIISTANFASEQDRIMMIGEPELRLALAAALASRSGLYSSLAYSWTNLFSAVEGLGRNMGFQSVFDVDLTTAERRNNQFNKPGLFVLKNPGNMQKAYKDLQESVFQSNIAWGKIRALGDVRIPDNQIAPFLDPRVFAPFTRTIDRTRANITALFDMNGGVKTDEGSIRSAVVQGETVEVNLYKFFHGDTIPKDLKLFLPSHYVQGPKEFKNEKDGREGRLAEIAGQPIRNYLQGSPDGWRIEVYNQYFPNIKGNKDVTKAARVLSQAWGGWIIGIPFSAMVL